MATHSGEHKEVSFQPVDKDGGASLEAETMSRRGSDSQTLCGPKSRIGQLRTRIRDTSTAWALVSLALCSRLV